MATMHDARSVANVLIARSMREDRFLDPLQINKLVYLCQGWMLGLYAKPLFRQHVRAWKYGPVVPDVYRSLKIYGADPVLNEIIGYPTNGFDRNEQALIEDVYNSYSNFKGIELSQITHEPGTPWHITWSKKGRDARIPNELIQSHYEQLYVERS